MSDARYKLIDAVLGASEADDWEDAVREWSIADCVEDPSATSTCVCGKDNLRYLFTIRNDRNHNELFPIGSSCIEKFGRKDLNAETRSWTEVFNLVHHAETFGKREKVPLDSKYFSRNILCFLFEKGAFVATKYNGGDGRKDYEFMVDMFNARSRTPAQERKVAAIVANSIYPFLRSTWKGNPF